MKLDPEFKDFIEETFLKLCGNMQMKVDTMKYPKWILGYGNDDLIFQWDATRENELWVCRQLLWDVLKISFNLNEEETGKIIKEFTKKHFPFENPIEFSYKHLGKYTWALTSFNE